ncbi:MAG: hypothetical protein ABI627_08570 [Polyangiaceae bacterium]
MSSLPSPTPPVAKQLTVVRDLADLLPREAFERAQPAARALRPDELIPLNVDLPRAVTVAAGALPRIMALRERALKELATIDARDFDELHTFTFAAAHAHALFMSTSRSEQGVKTLSARVVSLYGMLYLDALALSRRRLLAAEGVRHVPSLNARLSVMRTNPSGSAVSRSVASGGRRMYLSNASRPFRS